MKQNILMFVVLLSLMGFVSDEPYFEAYTPVLMKRSDLENSIKNISVQDLKNPGKIYFKGDTLYLVEKFEGIHVIDDSDPSNPTFISFITVPGIVDIAIKGQTLFADNAVDLVSINIKNLDELNVLSRVKSIFPELTPPNNFYIPDVYRKHRRPKNTIIVNWKKRES